MEFEWDPTKAAANLAKHRVSFEDAATVFGHSFQEERFVLLGLSESQRLLAVMYADRGEAIRIISARRVTRREQRNYEEKAH